VRNFEEDLQNLFEVRMKGSDSFCSEVWCSLSNIIWKNEDGSEFSATFRYAGGLIASIIEEGDYMDWYCSGEYATVSEDIANGLLTLGWVPCEYD